ncbi:MAG: HNH endonuclease [Planctomycetes bacterium]|nr:HNH endonuclease [Planctomycetota bacterium]
MLINNAKKLPDREILNNLLKYEPDTGKLYWRSRTPSLFENNKRSAEHLCNMWNARFSGKEAFIKINKGYKMGRIFAEQYSAHRIIWKMVTDNDPNEIDHINRDRADNKFENLRSVSHQENHQNLPLHKNNTSGIVGVDWDKARNKWRAQIKVNTKTVQIGRFSSKQDAIAARQQAEIEHGFHKNHGIPNEYL